MHSYVSQDVSKPVQFCTLLVNELIAYCFNISSFEVKKTRAEELRGSVNQDERDRIWENTSYDMYEK